MCILAPLQVMKQMYHILLDLVHGKEIQSIRGIFEANKASVILKIHGELAGRGL